jgi:nucleoside-triphosphatase
MRAKKNILITGLPGIGKTTLIKRLAETLKGFHPVGFYTAEIREGGMRQGFELISFDGRRSLLSHVSIRSPFRVSRYGVDIKRFEDFLDTLKLAEQGTRLVIIDEIGKMECYSEKFTALMRGLLDSGRPMLATAALKGGGFISGVKEREDVKLFEVTPVNRDSLVESIAEYVKALMQTMERSR